MPAARLCSHPSESPTPVCQEATRLGHGAVRVSHAARLGCHLSVMWPFSHSWEWLPGSEPTALFMSGLAGRRPGARLLLLRAPAAATAHACVLYGAVLTRVVLVTWAKH